MIRAFRRTGLPILSMTKLKAPVLFPVSDAQPLRQRLKKFSGDGAIPFD